MNSKLNNLKIENSSLHSSIELNKIENELLKESIIENKRAIKKIEALGLKTADQVVMGFFEQMAEEYLKEQSRLCRVCKIENWIKHLLDKIKMTPFRLIRWLKERN